MPRSEDAALSSETLKDAIGETETPIVSGKAEWHNEPPLGYALFRVMRAVFFDETPPAEIDALPMAQLRLLMTVHHLGDATMKDFSERLGVSQSTVTQLADRLVRRGLVERHADAADRRVVRLRVSPVGRTILRQSDQLRKHVLRDVWSSLSETDQQELLDCLETLYHRAEEARAAHGHPLTPWPEGPARPGANGGTADSPDQAQPMLDLMSRRVRGKTTAE